MSAVHEAWTERWLGCMPLGSEALLREVLLQSAEARPPERAAMVRSFVAWITGPRVRDGFARRVIACAADWSASLEEVAASSNQVQRLRERTAELTRQLEDRRRTGALGPLLDSRDALRRDNQAKHDLVARLQQTLADTGSLVPVETERT